MNSIYLLPIVIPITIIVPILLLGMIYKTAKKRIIGEQYIKDIALMSLISSFYTLFIFAFYL